MSMKSWPVIVFFLASGFFMSAHASAHDNRISKIDLNFAQTYGVTACPATAPASYLCLGVTGVLDQRETGRISFDRVALFNISLFDGSHPTCIPIETSGTLTLPRGTLKYHAPGNLCLAEGIASYDLIITGGTGAYAGALGGGKIIVPPPETNSTGRELWHIELFTNDRNEYRFY